MKRLKIPTDKGRYYYKIWLELYDGGSCQWLYVCRDVASYIFLEILDIVDACGRDADMMWSAEVSVVDLLTISPETLLSAIRGCGGENENYDWKSEMDRLRLAEMLFSHGAKARLWSGAARELTDDDFKNFTYRNYDERDPKFRTLRAEGRRFAEEQLFDEDSRNRSMDDTIVNKIGQTARQYMQGTEGLWDKLRDIKEQGDKATPEQRLFLKIYQNAETTIAAGPIPKDIKDKASK